MRSRPRVNGIATLPVSLVLACSPFSGGQGSSGGMPADTEATGGPSTDATMTTESTADTASDNDPSTTIDPPTSTGANTSLDGDSSTGEPEPFFRREITILGDQVAGTEPLMDFTVLVAFLGDDGLAHVDSGGHVLELDASDLLFRDDTLTPISHELVSYAPASGRMGVWVRVPEVAANSDTTIWLDYGAPSLVGQAPAGTWNDGYVGVWHFEDELADGGTVLDSSSMANHGTTMNMDAGDSEPGRVGMGVGFSQVDAAVRVGDDALDLPGPVTFEGWGRMDAPLSGWQRLFHKGNDGDLPLAYWVGDETVGQGWAGLGINFEQMDWLELSHNIPVFRYGDWHHYAAMVGGPGGDVALFVDGQRVDNDTYGYQIETGHPDLYFGNRNTPGNSRVWNGMIDEYRFSTVARSDAWIQTGYTNQNSPTSFTTVGPEQAMMP